MKEMKLHAKLVMDDSAKKAAGDALKGGLGLGDKGGGGGKGGGEMTGLMEGLSAFGKVGKSLSGVIGAGVKAGGAMEGAAAGSVVPGIGTAVGAAIGTAIGPMLEDIKHQLEEASPMLSETLGLTKTMVNMILKPFADAFAMFLIPIILFMYKYMIIPFYQYVYPAMMRLVTLMEPLMPLFDIMALALGLISGVLLLGMAVAIVTALVPLLLIVATLALIGIGIGYLSKAIVDAVSYIVDNLTRIWEDNVEPIIEGIVNAVTGSAKWVMNKIAWLSGWFEKVKSAIESEISKLVAPILELLTVISSLGDGLIEGIKDIIEQPSRILEFGFDAIKTILNGIGVVIGYVWTVLDTIWGILSDVKTVLVDTVGWVLGKVYDAVIWVKDEVINLLTSLGDLPGFQHGGDVPGPVGKPLLALLHGGEHVLRPGETGGGYSQTNNLLYITQYIQGIQDPEQMSQRVNAKIAEGVAMLTR